MGGSEYRDYVYVIQALAYLYSTTRPEMKAAIEAAFPFVEILVVVFHSAYIASIYFCQKAFKKLAADGNDPIQVKRVSNIVMTGQFFVIAALGCIAFVATLYI